MGTSTNTTHTASMPRITDKWGKYAKKDSGTNTTTTVSTNGTTVTTNAKNVKVNIFNGQPPQKPGNVIYKGRTFDIPKNIWGSPYPFAGLGNMALDAMPSIWGGGFGGGCKGHKLDNWDRFYQFANGPISGQVFGAAALGGLGGLAMGIGKALSGDDKKADKSDDSSKIKDYYNGTSGTTGTSGSSSTSSTSSSGRTSSSSDSGTKTETKTYEKLEYEYTKPDGSKDTLPQVTDYNNSLESYNGQKLEVDGLRNQVVGKQGDLQKATESLNAHKVKVQGLKDQMDSLKSALDSAIKSATTEATSEVQQEIEKEVKAENPNLSDEALQAKINEKMKTAKEKIEEKVKAKVKTQQDAYDAKVKEYNEAKDDTSFQDAYAKAKEELSSLKGQYETKSRELGKAATDLEQLKTRAEDAIQTAKTGETPDHRTFLQKALPNCLGGEPAPKKLDTLD